MNIQILQRQQQSPIEHKVLTESVKAVKYQSETTSPELELVRLLRVNERNHQNKIYYHI